MAMRLHGVSLLSGRSPADLCPGAADPSGQAESAEKARIEPES
jgi:hypothetical protein